MRKLLCFTVLLFIATPIYAQNGNSSSVRMSFGDAPVQAVSYWQFGDDEPRNDLGGVQNRATVDKKMSSKSIVDGNHIEDDWLAGDTKDGRDSVSAERSDSDSTDALDNEDYQLPRLADVNAPIEWLPMAGLRQADPSGLLHPYADRSSVELDEGTGYIVTSHQDVDQMTYDQLSGHPAAISTSTWEAPDFYHRPVCLEDPNLERYGNHFRFQNVRSGVRFFASIPTLPYQMGRDGMNSRIYTLQHDRPGDYVPSRSKDFTFDRRGTLLQGLVTSAIVIP